jgi:sugar phosphate isomerase/epimerase
MRFAVFTVSTPELSPEEAVRTFADVGYQGVEWRVIDQQPSPSGEPGFWSGNRCTLPLSTFVADAPRIKALAEQAGLETINVGAYAMCSELFDVEQVLKGAQLLGAPSARVRVPRYDGSGSYRQARDRAEGQFKDVEALAQRYGIRAIIETHPDTILPSASAVASFLAPFDPRWTGALWDPGNMVKEGYEQYRLGLEALGPYLAHVQIKNAAWRQVSTGWEFQWAPLNDGMVNVASVFETLRAVGYDGWISCEDFSTTQPLVDRLRTNLSYLQLLEQFRVGSPIQR